ncbi:MAG TPA: hypothetical protein VLK29_03875 [Luteimonas sp.]|nr:hypothetical protein [Luteimonas sp.]
MTSVPPLASFEEVERAQLMAWARLSADAKIDFFEEMVALAYQSGALAPERLALRDQPPAPRTLPPTDH